MSDQSVFKTIYEVEGDGLLTANAFFSEVDAARAEQWKAVRAFKAKGYRPGHNGRARSLFFAELPPGWRKIASEGKTIEAVPHKGSKAGKEADALFRAFPVAPDENHVARRFGWDRDYGVISGNRIHFATATRLTLPRPRVFIQLPRQIGDDYSPPASLREVTEGDFMRAIADHNDAVRSRKSLSKPEPVGEKL